MKTLEAAARAAYEAWIDDVRDLEPAWEDLPESHRYRLIQSARAVLMEVRSLDLPSWAHFEQEAWRGGIDAILGEGEGE